MTGFAISQPLHLRSLTGAVRIAALAVIIAALAAGAFVLGRVTDSSGGTTVSPVRTVWLQSVDAGSAVQACVPHVNEPC